MTMRLYCVLQGEANCNGALTDQELYERACRGAPDRVIPAHVQFALFPLVASDHDRQISVEHTETRLTLRF